MMYARDILIIGIISSFYKNNIYISSKSGSIKKSIKKTLSELFDQEVSGNIYWTALEIKETTNSLYLVFYGTVDFRDIKSEYVFKTIDNKLTDIEKTVLSELRDDVEKLKPETVKQLLGNEFLISELFGLYKAFVDKKKDRANFYKLVKKKDYIVPVGRRKREVYHRPPQYYKVNLQP